MKKLILILIILPVVFLFYFLAGFYNISALMPHNPIFESFAHITKHRSIKRNAANIIPPPFSVDKKLLKKGFDIYDSKCVQCHNGPGINNNELAKGLYPRPPQFPQDLEYDEIGIKEIFWATKNGIKMTGMPSYSNSLSDYEIWAVVHFVLKLPEITEEDYKDYRRTLIINF